MTARKAGARRIAAKKQILIVDDHPLMREGLRNTINSAPEMTVCGEAESAVRAMGAVQKLVPDLVLMDISLPGRNGLELIKDLKAIHPELRILVISMHDESLYAERALRAGASGYITKQQPPEELIRAIRRVLNDQHYVSARVSENILKRFTRHTGVTPASRLSALSDREFEILQLFGAGRSPREIAQQLHLSVKTVAVHNANIRQKLELKTTAQLVRFAVQSENMDDRARD